MDRRERLEALRDRLSAQIAENPPYLAGLSRELRAVLAELEQIAPAEKGTALDELGKRRRNRATTAARRAGATG